MQPPLYKPRQELSVLNLDEPSLDFVIFQGHLHDLALVLLRIRLLVMIVDVRDTWGVCIVLLWSKSYINVFQFSQPLPHLHNRLNTQPYTQVLCGIPALNTRNANL